MIPQIKVRLNLHINSTLMSHQMVFTFCAHIYSVAFSENHGSVTFSENRKIDDVMLPVQWIEHSAVASFLHK